MKAQEYREQVFKLLSVTDDRERCQPGGPLSQMAQFVKMGNILDLLKRMCFYTKKPDAQRARVAASSDSPLLAKIAGLPIDNLSQMKVTANQFHAILGIATEAAELVEELFNAIVENRHLDAKAILEERGDLEFYETVLDAEQSLDLHTIRRANLAKLMVRYGDGNKVFGGDRDKAAEAQAMDQAVQQAEVSVVFGSEQRRGNWTYGHASLPEEMNTIQVGTVSGKRFPVQFERRASMNDVMRSMQEVCADQDKSPSDLYFYYLMAPDGRVAVFATEEPLVIEGDPLTMVMDGPLQPAS